ncbi:MAG: bacteriocin [Lachnospiraceae bacterium]|nr:bacteriocin [Lachnospiraceae bacterium]
MAKELIAKAGMELNDEELDQVSGGNGFQAPALSARRSIETPAGSA